MSGLVKVPDAAVVHLPVVLPLDDGALERGLGFGQPLVELVISVLVTFSIPFS